MRVIAVSTHKASILQDGRIVFNVAGNGFIGTHRQYDTIDAQTI